jgi:hypothetical protein
MRFKVLLHGKNLLIPCEGKPPIIGFRVTRYVDALNEELAGQAALDAIFKEGVFSGSNTVSMPVVQIERLERVNWFAHRFAAKEEYRYYHAKNDEEI